jgi:hypothetical protein
MELKYKSLSARWFGCKAKKTVNNDDSSLEDRSSSDYISRDSLVTVHVTRGRNTTLEHYPILDCTANATTNGIYIGMTTR